MTKFGGQFALASPTINSGHSPLYPGYLRLLPNVFAPCGLFGQPFVKRLALCYRTVICPLCPLLCVCRDVGGQTVGWIKMPLGFEVGYGPGHNVLDGDPARSPPHKKHANHPQRPMLYRWTTWPMCFRCPALDL